MEDNTPVENPNKFRSWLRTNAQLLYGFFGWYVVAGLAMLVTPFSICPGTLLCLFLFARSKKIDGVATGILWAIALNFVISLLRGVAYQAVCFIPFFSDL